MEGEAAMSPSTKEARRKALYVMFFLTLAIIGIATVYLGHNNFERHRMMYEVETGILEAAGQYSGSIETFRDRREREFQPAGQTLTIVGYALAGLGSISFILVGAPLLIRRQTTEAPRVAQWSRPAP